MNKKQFFIGALLSLTAPFATFAGPSFTIDTVPSSVDADTYTFTIYLPEGATASVLGGPSNISPVTDGAGPDLEDGEVQVTVGLTQDAVNTFSISVAENGQASEPVLIEVNEVSIVYTDGKDRSAPARPILNEIPSFIDAIEYVISGEAEAYSNIYAYTVTGIVAGTSKANSNGFFQVTVDLDENKTNRFNLTAEDEAGNEGLPIQAVIYQVVKRKGVALEGELTTSAQLFFDDVNGHWAEGYINRLGKEGIVSGKADRIFDPSGFITRAELTKVAILAMGHSVNSATDEHPFQDVPRNSWFAPYIEEAVRLGIASGYPSGGYGPNDFITRAAALKIILAAADFDINETENSFTDVPSSAWYAGFVSFANNNNIVAGYGDGTFRPGRNITRAEVAKIVVRVLDLRGGEILCDQQEYEGQSVNFNYPCDWIVQDDFGVEETGLQFEVKVDNGDGKMRQYATDFDATDLEVPTILELTIGGIDYLKKTYQVDIYNAIVLYEVDDDSGDVAAHFELYYKSPAQLSILEAILSTLSFN